MPALRFPDGREPGWHIDSFEDEEVFPEGVLEHFDDDVEFNEYTGNEGATYERRYQRTVVACWPRERSLKLLLRGSTTRLAGWLLRLMQEEELTGISAPALAASLIQEWPISVGRWLGLEAKGDLLVLLEALVLLEDGDLVLDAVDRIGVAVPLQSQVADGWAKALRLLGPDADAALARILRARVGTEPGACAALARAFGGRGSLAPLVEAIAAGVSLDAGALAEVALAFVDEPDSLQKMATVWAPRLDVDKVLLPALVSLAGKARLKVPLRPIVQRVQEVLDQRVAAAPRPPADFVRSSASITCRCAICADVKGFLASPTQEEWRLSAVQVQRYHVEANVAGADVTRTTVKRGSPHTLVLTKSLKSYEVAVAEHKKQIAARQGLDWWV